MKPIQTELNQRVVRYHGCYHQYPPDREFVILSAKRLKELAAELSKFKRISSDPVLENLKMDTEKSEQQLYGALRELQLSREFNS